MARAVAGQQLAARTPQLNSGPLSTRRYRSGAAGQELVELALLLPVLLLIVFGVLDLGRLFHVYITITNSSREGARFGSFDPSDVAGIRGAAKAEASGSGIALSDSMIAASCPSGCGSGLPVRVTIDYPFQLVTGLFLANPNLNLNSAAEMMVP